VAPEMGRSCAAWALMTVAFGWPVSIFAQDLVHPAVMSRPRPLIVVVTTEGAAPDPDGYTITVTGASPVDVGPNVMQRFDGLSAGTLDVGLTGVAPNCRVSGDSRHVLTKGILPDTTRLRVDCPEPQPPPPSPRTEPIPVDSHLSPSPPVARIRSSTVDDSTTLIRVSAVAAGDDLVENWRARLVAERERPSDGTIAEQTLLDTLFAPPAELHDDRIVRPESTTRYVFTVTGPTGEATAETTVVVRTRVETDIRIRVDTVMQVDTIRPENERMSSQGVDWWWGPGIGSAGVITGAASVIVPFVASVSVGWSDNWTVTLRGGLSPADSPGTDPVSPGDPRPAFHSRTLKMVSLGVTVFPTGRWWGGALSYVGAWEMVRGLDYYTKRAYGPSVGPRGRWDFRPWDLVRLRLSGGVDLQYAHVSAYDEPVPEWKFGVTVPVALTLVLD